MLPRGSGVALGILVVLCLLGGTAAAADHEVTLTVVVVDEAGEPVGSGVTVEATWDGGEAVGETAANGRVLLDVPEGTDVELDVDDDRYVRNQPLSVPDADQRDVELQAFPSGTATVSVTDADGGPLSDATVRFRRGGEVVSSGETDADGVFESATVEDGQYSLQVVKPGYYRFSDRLDVDGETDTGVALEAGRVTLDVAVLDDHFAEPRRVSDARVLVEAPAVGFDANVSASDGVASLNVPVNARYRIAPTKPGYVGSDRSVDVTETDRSVNVTAQRAPELTVAVSNQRVVVGESTRVTVRNAYDEPVPNATVRLDGTSAGSTDARGELSVRIDDPGELTIAASDGDLDSEPVTVTGVTPETVTESPDPTGTTETGRDIPGFGIVGALLALLVVSALTRR